MIDLKTLKSAFNQLESDRGISKEKIIEAIEDALAAAYKKDYGKRGQIIRAEFDLETGKTSFYQIKTVVDESIVRIEEDEEKNNDDDHNNNKKRDVTKKKKNENLKEGGGKDEEEQKIRFNSEHHIFLEDAQKN